MSVFKSSIGSVKFIVTDCNQFFSTTDFNYIKFHFVSAVNLHLFFRSGLFNFCSVALALSELGYKAIGIRLDSGDLAYLSCIARQCFTEISLKYNLPWFENLIIMASNDINEETILSLNEQGHKINCFGIGTHLVTCQRQPALGCVYKMVELNGQPRLVDVLFFLGTQNL